MTILLVRHARAGSRDRWKGDDRLRPLSKKGQMQAHALPERVMEFLAGSPPRLVSSPWVRCVETLGPLAAAVGIPAQRDDVLGEGMGDKAVEKLPLWMRDGPTVLCTHGDVIERILVELAGGGLRIGRPRQAAKGSVWVLTGPDGMIDAARYLPALA